jgi:ATP-dependent protease ClpP protease subunit
MRTSGSFLCSVMLLVAATGGATDASAIIELNKTNHISLVGPIDMFSSNMLHAQLHALQSMPQYIYIDSPGGLVDGGIEIVSLIRTVPNATCIAARAYSMAFAIFQHCARRIILETGSLMQHQIHFSGQGMSGDLWRVQEELRFVKSQYTWLLASQASRIGVSTEWFENRTRDEWWLFGSEAVENGCADIAAFTVSCAKSMNISECPLYTSY